MKLTSLLKLYRLAKDWEIIDGKLSIPDKDLPKLDIREGDLVLTEDYNPFNKSVKGQFMPDMDEADFAKWQAEKSGWQKFYNKVLGK